MKKIVYFLIALLLLPVVANADVAMPEIKEYDAVVVKDEVPYYSESGIELKEVGKLPKGTKVTIKHLLYKDNEVYGMITYNKKSYVVNTKDVFVDDNLGINEQYVRAEEEDRKILIVGEATMRKGPIDSYEAVATINDQELTYRFTFQDDNAVAYYVEYNGKKGWLSDKSNVYIDGSDAVVIEDFRETSCKKAKEFDIIKEVWMNNEYQWTIDPKGEKCEVAVSDAPKLFPLTGYKETVKLEEDMTFSVGMESVTKVTAGEELIIYTEEAYRNGNWIYYAEYNGEKGWLIQGNRHGKFTVISKEKIEEEKPEEPEKPKKEEKEEKTDTNVVIISCVVGAIAFALGVLITIILVNKKKNKPVENVVETVEQK